MPSRAQRERGDRQRALRVLAGAPEGMTEALMLAHGFRVGLLEERPCRGLGNDKSLPTCRRASKRTNSSS
jgi:hypothetical protein